MCDLIPKGVIVNSVNYLGQLSSFINAKFDCPNDLFKWNAKKGNSF